MGDLNENELLSALRELDRESVIEWPFARLKPLPRKMIFFSNPTGCNWVKNIWNEEMARNDQEMR